MPTLNNQTFGLSSGRHTTERGVASRADVMGQDRYNSVGLVGNPRGKVDTLKNFDIAAYFPQENYDPYQNNMRSLETGSDVTRKREYQLTTIWTLLYDEQFCHLVKTISQPIYVLGGQVSWTSYFFAINELDRISELTAGRVDSYGSSSESTSLEKRGKSIRVEHDFLNTPEGKQIFLQLLHNLALATNMTQGKDIVNTLLYCKRVNRAPSMLRDQFVNKNMKIIMRKELLLWDILKQDAKGLQTVFNIMDQDCKQRGVKLNTCIGSSTIKNVMLMHNENREYSKAGQPGVAIQHALATELLETAYGYKFVPIYQMLRKQNGFEREILKSYSQIGEFFISKDLNRNSDFSNYNSLNRAVNIYDEEQDRMQTITVQSMIDNCQKFDKSGCPLVHWDFPKRDSAVDYTQSQVDRDPFLYRLDPDNANSSSAKVKYFGQIERKHFKSIHAVAKSASTAVLRGLPTMTSDLSDMIFQIKDLIRMVDNIDMDDKVNYYFQKLIAQYSNEGVDNNNRYNTNPTVANLKEGKPIYGINIPSPPVYDATTDGDNDFSLLPFPPGYQNWSGLMAVADWYTNNRDNAVAAYPNAEKNFSLAAKFVSAFKRFVRNAMDQWQDCIFLDERLCASYHLNPSSEHTAFENLICSGQLPAFALRDKRSVKSEQFISRELVKEILNFNIQIRKQVDKLPDDEHKNTVKNAYDDNVMQLLTSITANPTLRKAIGYQVANANAQNEQECLDDIKNVDFSPLLQPENLRKVQALYALCLYVSNGTNSKNNFLAVLESSQEATFQEIINQIKNEGLSSSDTIALLDMKCRTPLIMSHKFKNALINRMNEVDNVLDEDEQTVSTSDVFRMDVVISVKLAKSLLTKYAASFLKPADPRCLDRPLTSYNESIFDNHMRKQINSLCHLNHLPKDPQMMQQVEMAMREAPQIQEEDEFFHDVLPNRNGVMMEGDDDPNSQLCKACATIQLKGFTNLWHEVNKTVKDPLHNVMAKIYMGTPLNQQQLQMMAEEHIVIPFQFLLFRVGTYGQLMLIGCIDNGGSVLLLQNIEQRKIGITTDNTYRYSIVSFYFPFKAIVPDPNTVYHMSNTFISGCEGGMGTEFIDPDKYSPRNNNYGYPGSLFCVLTSYEDKISNPLSLTGVMKADDKGLSPSDITDNHNDNLSYSTAHFYNQIYEFPGGVDGSDTIMQEDFGEKIDSSQACSICFRGLTLYHNQKTSGFDLLSHGTGHWKDLATYPGAAATRQGQCTAYVDYWQNQNLTLISESL